MFRLNPPSSTIRTKQVISIVHLHAPLDHVKYLKAGPARLPFQNWYTVRTNHLHLTDFCLAETKTLLS